ncbi:pectinacetylesterase family protein [Nannochloropsis gaditana CCMP526]|uniref:pectinacetylesterase family protein n=1 Tax=Nannochloropsis gaditana (strain CCMP526) TaxID=1093141 RepID=UPI00029F733E|nr:pectinacetylesterase family protein [Nannochloropsis gaditana CCMP526]EKU22422.1 pectinacetylesterase family protein [Nannochloropsis gaditana CCMP526]|eukprot:XP_005853933.1 pectinacetylesterase family protein [Nannochloropsis gaditana CCMP526]
MKLSLFQEFGWMTRGLSAWMAPNQYIIIDQDGETVLGNGFSFTKVEDGALTSMSAMTVPKLTWAPVTLTKIRWVRREAPGTHEEVDGGLRAYTHGSRPAFPSVALEWDMVSSDPETNPGLHNWNVVFVKYCDGNFWSGATMDTEEMHDLRLHFRGKFIQEAIMRDLTDFMGLDKGEELVFAGCSAGAMIAYLQVDYWAASGLIPPSIRKVRVMASAVGRRSGGGTCRGRLVFPTLWRKKSLLR